MLDRPACDPDPDLAKVVAFAAGEALSLALARRTRFTPQHLAEHVASNPGLAYHIRGNLGKYIVGGFWRHRAEIGVVLELVADDSRAALLNRLLSAYRSRGSRLVLLDPLEQEQNLRFYLERGFAVVDTLLQLERQGLRVEPVDSACAIRPMEEHDVEPILAVERHAFPWIWWNSEAELRWYATIPGVELHVAEIDARVVAYAGFTVFERQAHLDRLAVHREYQRRGLGRALLAHAMHRMHELGARRVALTTQIDNLASHALYKNLGFRESGWRHDICGLRLR